MSSQRRTLCLDFDGVVHAYSRGWQDGLLYDVVVPGWFEWAKEAADKFHLVIYSSRSETEAGIASMKMWMAERALQADCWDSTNQICDFLDSLQYAASKPAAFLTIDDRCIRFTGDWSAPELQPEALMAFRPWNQKPPAVAGDRHRDETLGADHGLHPKWQFGYNCGRPPAGCARTHVPQTATGTGLPYPKSSCQRCGSLLSPGWRCAEDASKGASNSATVTKSSDMLEPGYYWTRSANPKHSGIAIDEWSGLLWHHSGVSGTSAAHEVEVLSARLIEPTVSPRAC